jgi:hypothetical protein
VRTIQGIYPADWKNVSVVKKCEVFGGGAQAPLLTAWDYLKKAFESK